ncbi:hypothetical protein [Streptomyces olivochromogenes]|uniref:hypothetical protein n=1 Tax=Streptomyces olivochromogenes TaxID=1963 RepID=UPI00368B8646
MRHHPHLASRHGGTATPLPGPVARQDQAFPGTGRHPLGDRFAFTARALSRLTGDHDHGVNATLQARFSSGLRWKIHVTTYDTPQRANATGTSNPPRSGTVLTHHVTKSGTSVTGSTC